jgi:hypothetical protein
MLLVTEMMSHLSVQDPFNQGFGELLEETALTEWVFGFLIVFQKFIEDFFSDGHDRSFPRMLSRMLSRASWPFTQLL